MTDGCLRSRGQPDLAASWSTFPLRPTLDARHSVLLLLKLFKALFFSSSLISACYNLSSSFYRFVGVPPLSIVFYSCFILIASIQVDGGPFSMVSLRRLDVTTGIHFSWKVLYGRHFLLVRRHLLLCACSCEHLSEDDTYDAFRLLSRFLYEDFMYTTCPCCLVSHWDNIPEENL